ncbi:ATP-dependent RNA helicase dbp6 [Apophysomyces sp. BC1034]|nr:ATP-dependent RNA helicase dbp6 [Apophysomyces sp. BC1015]KAG0181221.1 ATP-dependent RNA helicase dbp6 [Apophysomyces sp. BC1021]KAG0190837.1 ATP-dependent RNA helicase dbp6 [Apophysomyces sp. BC1034]
MFSIARYQGEDQPEDERTLEKKQERLGRLLEKVNRKRKIEEEAPAQTDETSIATEKKRKKSKKQTQTTHLENEGMPAENVQEEDEDDEEEKTSEVEQKEGAENEINATVPDEKEADVALEAFPDMIGSKENMSKENIQLLRNMGVPEWLLQPTSISPEQTCELDQTGLSSELVQRCRDLGLTSFFAVQMAVIPVFLRRQALYDTIRAPGDLCISAPTGSGKTLAYVLPIVDILSKRVITRLRALIILPTRDLVVQVKETFDAFVKGTNLTVATVVGQQSFSHEQQILVGKGTEKYAGGKSRVDILIATPGRLMDHLKETPNFTLQHLRFLVIDEADRLLNQSYHDWLNQILLATRPTERDVIPIGFKKDNNSVTEADAIAPSFLRSHFDLPSTDLDLEKAASIQKLLFSATLTKNPAKIAGLHLTNPEYISVQRQGDETDLPQYTTPAGLKEFMTICSVDQKPLMLIYLLHHLKIKSGLCFTKSVESTQRLQMLIDAYEAKREGPKTRVAEYSSELNASQRKSMLKRFKEGEIDLMICSDLIGRGIDLDCVQTVISYDVPVFMDKYIHRVGRTARAGREGEAYTLVEKQEARHFKEMLRSSGHLAQVKLLRVEKEKLGEFEDDYKEALAGLAK